MKRLTVAACLLFLGLVASGRSATSSSSVNDDRGTGGQRLSEPTPWDDRRMDERIFADAPNYLTYQLNRKRYSVPYHPVARLRASQTAGVVLPYAMIANRNYVNDEGNRYETAWKPTAAELLTVLMNRRKNANAFVQDNTNFMRYGISKRRTRADGDDGDDDDEDDEDVKNYYFYKNSY